MSPEHPIAVSWLSRTELHSQLQDLSVVCGKEIDGEDDKPPNTTTTTTTTIMAASPPLLRLNAPASLPDAPSALLVAESGSVSVDGGAEVAAEDADEVWVDGRAAEAAAEAVDDCRNELVEEVASVVDEESCAASKYLDAVLGSNSIELDFAAVSLAVDVERPVDEEG